MRVWREYDQAGLDKQYGTRDQIGDQYEPWTKRWQRESEATRIARKPLVDVRYGPHARHSMDIFPAVNPTGADPIAVFFHGGFWRSRDKADYSYVANGLGSLGCLVAVVNYPLCPAATLDEVVGAARLSVRWLLRNGERYGGDSGRLYVSGHSAGAHLAAMCFSGDGIDEAELPEGSVKGALLTSGIYELEPVRQCFANADVRLDAEQVRRLSPARLRASGLAGPLILGFGTAETEEFDFQSNLFAGVLAGLGDAVSVVPVSGANHYTIVPQFAESGSLLLNEFRKALLA